MTITEELSAHVVRATFDGIPAESVKRAKWRVIDAIGCLIAGANAAGCRDTVDLVRGWGGTPESTVLVHGIKAPAHHAALANSLMTRSFDFEPVDAEGEAGTSAAHISGTTIPTALAMSERQGSSGSALLEALIIADDLAARICTASGFDFAAGWDNTGTVNGLASTALSCKLMRQSEVQLSNALGIALNQLGGSLQHVWDKVMTFKLVMAMAARNGIFAAEMAERGFTGQRDALGGRFGYFKLFTSSPDTTRLTKDLGKKYYADCVIKPYSACRATHTSIDSALKIATGNDFQTDDIEEVVVSLSKSRIEGFTGQPFETGITPQIDGAFSIRFTVATALLRKWVKPAYFTEECIGDPRIHALIGKMKMVPITPPTDTPMRSEMHVKLKDGRVLSASTDLARGNIFETPLSDDEILEKFWDNVAYSRTIPRSKAGEALTMLRDLEHVDDVRKITALLS